MTAVMKTLTNIEGDVTSVAVRPFSVPVLSARDTRLLSVLWVFATRFGLNARSRARVYTQTDRQAGWQTDRQTETETDTVRSTQNDRDRQTLTETESDRDKEPETETEKKRKESSTVVSQPGYETEL